ncbi:MAG TPA: hypothetical protein VMM13_04310 [Euzebya sp.]|nr:hypothetical protein [Euzebya sp.]
MSAATERDVAEVLGASPRQARSLVTMISEAGLLTHGVVVVCAVAAARWGVLLQDAVVEMAEGRGVPEGISTYELRIAAEEGEADVEAVWAAAQHAGHQDHAVWQRLRRSPTDTTQGDLSVHGDCTARASAFNIDVSALLGS